MSLLLIGMVAAGVLLYLLSLLLGLIIMVIMEFR